jgi:hypothetical protein
MSLRQTKSMSVGVLACAALGIVGSPACGGESPQPAPTVDQPSTETEALQTLGDAIGHYRNGHLEIVPSAAAVPGAAQLQNFGKQFTQNKITFDTAATDGVGVLGCLATQYCADITLTNNTGTLAQTIYVEITDYFNVTPAGSPIAWANGAFPLTTPYSTSFVKGAAAEAASYGDLASGANNHVIWKFDVGSATNFDFHVKVYATFPRPTVSGTIYTAANAAPAVDACAVSGAVTYFPGGDDGEQPVTLPFTYSLLDLTYDLAVVSTNGYVLFYKTGDAVPSLSQDNVSVNSGGPAGLYPFWDDFGYDGTDGVCVATSGTAPNRLWNVTWKNAKISTNQPIKPSIWSTEKVTVSLSIQESSDLTRFYYPAQTTITSLTRGISMTVGYRAFHSPYKFGFTTSFNKTWLPATSTPQAYAFVLYPQNP